MTIDITLFEKFVPASRGSSWNKLETYADMAESKLRNQFFGDQLVDLFKDMTTDTFYGKSFARALTNLAYYEAIPFVDLIQTDTGFAIVSTSNLAPASKERVAAIREASKKVAYLTIADMLNRIIKDTSYRTQWLSATESDYYTSGLIWVPGDLGVKAISADDLIEELPNFRKSERFVAQYVSDDLIDRMIQSRTESELQKQDLMLYRMIIRAVLEHFRQTGSNDLSYLIAYLNKNAESYPEYAQSDAYQANNWKETPDSNDDTCFFMV